MKVITQIYLIRAFVTDHLQQKQFDDTYGDANNNYLLFRSY